jgi:hypothetical protein
MSNKLIFLITTTAAAAATASMQAGGKQQKYVRVRNIQPMDHSHTISKARRNEGAYTKQMRACSSRQSHAHAYLLHTVVYMKYYLTEINTSNKYGNIT